MSAPTQRPDQPLPNLWSDRNRGRQESALDSETAVSLACHLHDTFAQSPDWNALLDALNDRGFSLEFQADRLTLINDQTGVRLCTCSVLGHGLAALTARLGKPCVQAATRRLIRSPADDCQR